MVEGEVEPLVLRSIEAHLKDTPFDNSKVPLWVNSICEDCIAGLVDLGKPFKYIVSCVIAQNTGEALNTSISSFCDTVNDGVCVVKWPTEKKTDANPMYCIVTVFGLAF